jgi:hypothetical protein
MVLEVLKDERVRLNWFEEGSILFKTVGFKIKSSKSKYNGRYKLSLKQLLKTNKETIRSRKTIDIFLALVNQRSKNTKWSLSQFINDYSLEYKNEHLLFEFYTPNNFWSVPWELLMSVLFDKHQELVSSTGIIRIFDGPNPEYPNLLLDKLDILFIKGDEAKGASLKKLI